MLAASKRQLRLMAVGVGAGCSRFSLGDPTDRKLRSPAPAERRETRSRRALKNTSDELSAGLGTLDRLSSLAAEPINGQF